MRPETVIGWHRTAWRRYWTWKSRGRRPGRPRIDPELRELIVRLARENPGWGVVRIVGELRALGFAVSTRTVRRDRTKALRRPPWRQLLEATPWGVQPRHLIRDRDRCYGTDFIARASRIGIHTILTPVHTPNANAVAERVIGTLRRECLDREGAPAYLESSKERNVPLYERFGFKVTEAYNLPKDGPRVWSMWRDPK